MKTITFKLLILFFLLFALGAADIYAVKNFTPEETENIRIYQATHNGVVNISSITVNYDVFFRPVPTESGMGTGFVIDKRGYILTNYHVVENSVKLVITLSDNSQWAAQVIGVDPNSDLAVIKTDAPARLLTVLELADSSDIVIGQKVLALGNPFGLKQTLTTGIVSALGRTIEARNGRKIEGAIQTDAAINPGNSGGPLLDSEGKVIGINSQIIGSAGNVGIGFAIPSNTAKRIIPDLITYGFVRRPWLGVEPIPTSHLERLGLDVPKGMLVHKIVRGGSAAQAGIRGATKTVMVGNYLIPWGGDIITHIDKVPVQTFEELASEIESHQPGDVISVKVIRNGKIKTIPVKLEQRPRPR